MVSFYFLLYYSFIFILLYFDQRHVLCFCFCLVYFRNSIRITLSLRLHCCYVCFKCRTLVRKCSFIKADVFFCSVKHSENSTPFHITRIRMLLKDFPHGWFWTHVWFSKMEKDKWESSRLKCIITYYIYKLVVNHYSNF